LKSSPVYHGLHYSAATRHRVAAYHHVGIRRDVLRAIIFHERDSLVLKEARHRWVNILVGPSDLKAALSQRDRDRAHRCPANSEEVKTVGRFFHAGFLRRVSEFG